MKSGRVWMRTWLLVMVWALSAGLPLRAAATDYTGIVEQIFATGEARGETTSLSFIDGDLHQYAVAEGAGPEYLVSLSFIEEEWTREGDDDVIDQWIIHVEPVPYAGHIRMVERDSVIISSEPLSTDGSEAVVRRIVEKIRQQGRRAGLAPSSGAFAGQ